MAGPTDRGLYPSRSVTDHHFSEFLFVFGKMGGGLCTVEQSIRNALRGLAKVRHRLYGGLEIVPVSSWVVWTGAKALVGAGTQHFDRVIVAFNVEQKVVRRAPGIHKAGKRSVLLGASSFESGLIADVAARARVV